MTGDLKFSVRTLFNQPAFAVVAIITLSLGIGATTAVFSILNAVLLADLPYNDPGRLYMLRSLDAKGNPTALMAPRYVAPLLQGHPSVEGGTFGWGLAGSVIAADGTPYPFLPYRVTPRFFDVFNQEIALGRGFQSNEPPASIIISYATWKNYFKSDPNIVGAPIRVDNSPRTVVGVVRESFEFPKGAQAWQPLYTGPALDNLVNFEAYLRLRPGVTSKAFERELAALSKQLGPLVPNGKPFTYVLRPLQEEVVGDLGSTVLILSGATTILLLIGCLNVANLLLARARARAHEIGLREAVGAGRLRIIRQLLTESLLLSTIGGLLGVGLAYAGVRLMLSIGPADLPRLGGTMIDRRVLLFSAGAVLLTSLLVGLAPALRLSRTQLRTLMHKGGRGGTLGRAEYRVFGALVIAEIGLAVVLVIGAGLLLRSYINLTSTDPGFDSSRILSVRLNATHLPIDIRANRRDDGTMEFNGTGYQRIIDFYNELMTRVRGIAGVANVAGAQELPLYLNPTQASPEPFTIVGRPGPERLVRIRPVSSGFFDTLGARILAGRGLEPTDRKGTPGVAVINEAFARQYFSNEDPIGQRLGLPSRDFEPGARGYGFAERIYDSVEIVGVVSDVRFTGLFEPPPPYLFMSADQFTTRLRVLAVKTRVDDPAKLIPAIRQLIAEMAPTIPVEFAIYTQSVEASIARERLGTALLTVFGMLALILAAVGVYGVMTYSVTQRTGEIAVRSALGASAGQVLGLIIGRGVKLGFAGVSIGLAGAVALRRVVAGQLYGVSPLDPGVLVLVPLVLLVVVLVACFVPAIRASRIDPTAALRHD
jgi:putative ABC transport system permease protein